MCWILAGCWNAYWFLLRFVYRLDADENTLRWRAPLRRGEVPLTALDALTTFPLGGQVQRITSSSGPTIWINARKGIEDFSAELAKRAPQLTVKLSWSAKLTEKVWGRSGFRSG